MLDIKFFSDCNYDGFVQSIARLSHDYHVYPESRRVFVPDGTDEIELLASNWGGQVTRV